MCRALRDRQRPRYGFYVDHVVDVFGAAFLMIGLALSPYMSPMVGLGLLILLNGLAFGGVERHMEVIASVLGHRCLEAEARRRSRFEKAVSMIR